ncbi:MAG: MFS transporter [Verrucomicrobia bacterium]|nr:MFS transporter [Verrucomicrobiota bacterium]
MQAEASSGGEGTREVRSLRDLSPAQWKSGAAAWLGWLFDGLDMHLYGLVAAPFVAQLLDVASPADAMVREKSSWIQAAFLVGWALGGGFFGRLGDLIGRSRALCLTILTYALFTGLSFFAQTWWQLLIFRFITALGIGGEWAVGSSLLSETWPKRWRPWIAAVLQTGVNLGVLLACATVFLSARYEGAIGQLFSSILPDRWTPEHWYPRFVFLVGVLPAFLVLWIRRHVPEPEEWHAARRNASRAAPPGIMDLFRGEILRTTLLTIVVCATSLTAWWAFMFWHSQHLRNLPELASWARERREELVSTAFFVVISSSIAGNFFASWLARRWGYRRAIALTCLGFLITMSATFIQDRPALSLVWFWFPAVGFFSGVFGLFTMYLPPLFPTLLRTTGAGFCYNIGRIVSACGVVFSGTLSRGGDFKTTLLFASMLFIPAMVVAVWLPEPDELKA